MGESKQENYHLKYLYSIVIFFTQKNKYLDLKLKDKNCHMMVMVY